jgi:hypothetical protein
MLEPNGKRVGTVGFVDPLGIIFYAFFSLPASNVLFTFSNRAIIID